MRFLHSFFRFGCGGWLIELMRGSLLVFLYFLHWCVFSEGSCSCRICLFGWEGPLFLSPGSDIILEMNF